MDNTINGSCQQFKDLENSSYNEMFLSQPHVSCYMNVKFMAKNNIFFTNCNLIEFWTLMFSPKKFQFPIRTKYFFEAFLILDCRFFYWATLFTLFESGIQTYVLNKNTKNFGRNAWRTNNGLAPLTKNFQICIDFAINSCIKKCW